MFTALKDDPHYVKVLQRRAASNETLNTWTSLASAQEGPSLFLHPASPLRLTSSRSTLNSVLTILSPCVTARIELATDYNTLLSLLPSGSSQSREVQRSLASLKPRVEAAQKRETDEMFGKLKGLGNSILGACFPITESYDRVHN